MSASKLDFPSRNQEPGEATLGKPHTVRAPDRPALIQFTLLGSLPFPEGLEVGLVDQGGHAVIAQGTVDSPNNG